MMVNSYDYSPEIWPLRHFAPRELECSCCGRIVDTPAARAAWNLLDSVRDLMGEPVHINSATRCERHNKAVGGAQRSYHLRGLAFDIATRGNGQTASFEIRLLHAAGYLGFGGVGVYQKFIHLDTRALSPSSRPTVWFG